MKLPLLQSFKKIRALMGADFGTIKKLCSTCMSKWIRPITALLRKGVKHDLTPAMEVVVREILIELATAPSLVFPDWGDIADGSRPCHVSCDSSIGCWEPRSNRSNRAVRGYPSRASTALPSPFLEALDPAGLGRWRHSLGHQTTSTLPMGHQGSHIFGPQSTHEHRQRRGLQRTRLAVARVVHASFDYALQYRKGSTNGNVDVLSRLLEFARPNTTAVGLAASPPSRTSASFASERLRAPRSLFADPGVGLGELVPRPNISVSGGLPFTSSDVREFRRTRTACED